MGLISGKSYSGSNHATSTILHELNFISDDDGLAEDSATLMADNIAVFFPNICRLTFGISADLGGPLGLFGYREPFGAWWRPSNGVFEAIQSLGSLPSTIRCR